MSLTGVTFPIFITVALLACTWLVNRVRRIGAREPGLPPGPPTLPLLGNLHLFPTRYAHLKYVSSLLPVLLLPIYSPQLT